MMSVKCCFLVSRSSRPPLPELVTECLGQERISSHNLASRVRAIVCSEDVSLMEEQLTRIHPHCLAILLI